SPRLAIRTFLNMRAETRRIDREAPCADAGAAGRRLSRRRLEDHREALDADLGALRHPSEVDAGCDPGRQREALATGARPAVDRVCEQAATCDVQNLDRSRAVRRE